MLIGSNLGSNFLQEWLNHADNQILLKSMYILATKLCIFRCFYTVLSE